MSKPSQRVRLRDRLKRPLDGALQFAPRSRAHCSQPGFDLRPALLNRRQVGRVRRQVDQASSARFYRFTDATDFMRPEVVHHDDVAGSQCWAQHPLRVSPEHLAVSRPFNRQQGIEPAAGERPDQRQVLTIVERRAAGCPLAPRGAAIPACQRQIHARFVNELEPAKIQPGDYPLVLGARLLDPFGVAFRSVERLFLRGRLSACSSRLMVGRETDLRCLAFTRRQSSSRVKSLLPLTHCWMKRRAFSSSSGLLPPACGRASGEPVSRLRRRKFLTVARLTWNSSATSPCEYLLLSQASTIRWRKSLE